MSGSHRALASGFHALPHRPVTSAAVSRDTGAVGLGVGRGLLVGLGRSVGWGDGAGMVGLGVGTGVGAGLAVGANVAAPGAAASTHDTPGRGSAPKSGHSSSAIPA